MENDDVSFSSISELEIKCVKYIPPEPLYTSSDDCSDRTMPVIADVMTVESKTKNTQKQHPKFKLTKLVTYGPIRIRRRQSAAVTIATGRRPKDAIIDGEEAEKRELRRQKNREAARNLKKLRDGIAHKLAKEVDELESEEKELLTKVTNLRTYKDYLEEHCKQLDILHELIARTMSNALAAIERNKQNTSQNLSSLHDQTEQKLETTFSITRMAIIIWYMNTLAFVFL